MLIGPIESEAKALKHRLLERYSIATIVPSFVRGGSAPPRLPIIEAGLCMTRSPTLNLIPFGFVTWSL